MILIASGGYIDKELQSVFGKIPPSFLPVKNKRLFVLQSEFFGNEKTKYISLPNDFEIDPSDFQLLKELNFVIIRCDASSSLGESLFSILEKYVGINGNIKLLLGDTLFLDSTKLLCHNDCFSISEISDFYPWAQVESFLKDKITYSGFFSFSKADYFIQLLHENNFNFEDSLNLYKKKITVLLFGEGVWLDFGHHNTYFRSKSLLSTEREFNKLNFFGKQLTKTSLQKEKMLAESEWFNMLPKKLRIHTPHFLGEIENQDIHGYSVEYLHNATLSELFLFAKLPLFVWDKIIDDSFLFLENLVIHKIDFESPLSFDEQLIQKTLNRLKIINNDEIDIFENNSFNGEFTPSLIDICLETKAYLENNPFKNNTIVHGDFCFSNILYDFQAQLIKVIDPRGMSLDGRITNSGNIVYDLGKYFHSIIGYYDLILSGYYKLEFSRNNFNFHICDNNKYHCIQELFLSKSFHGLSMNSKVLWAININLFLSMVPLHSENPKRQNAFIANALRLYLELKKK